MKKNHRIEWEIKSDKKRAYWINKVFDEVK